MDNGDPRKFQGRKFQGESAKLSASADNASLHASANKTSQTSKVKKEAKQ
jgi:hypothetical protein